MGLVFIMVVAQLADLVTFSWVVDARGIRAEANPVVVWLYGVEPSLPVVFKLASILLMASAYLTLQDSRPMLALVLIWLAIFLGLIGAISNVISLL